MLFPPIPLILSFNFQPLQRHLTTAILATLVLGLLSAHATDGITTIRLAYIGDLGDGTGDYDGDGLTDWEEVKRYHTDPRHVDSDGDGCWDGQELRAGTNPLLADTDGDGFPDGWTPALYASHRLFNPRPGDRTVTIRLTRPTPAGNHAVLLVGDLPLLLCETNSWTLSIPTGTVWNVELKVGERRWCGTPVHLELEGGVGVFAENAGEVFASVLMAEERQTALRSAPPGPPPGGSRGGSARLYAPCIFLEPSMQVVHENGSATVRARCIPDTPPLSGKLTWSFEPDYMATLVNVADDKMSATVSGMDGGWHSSVTLHASAGDSLVSQAVVHFCHGHGIPSNAVSFPPPHTNATVRPVFRTCDHPFGDDPDDPNAPNVFLEVEVGRDTASGWQHLAWVDTNPSTPGFQRRTAISRDDPPAFNWDAKATSSAPLADGLDTLVYDNRTTFARALPAVAAGQYVPPPFAKIVTRTFDRRNHLLDEFSTPVAIPQYVQVTWNAAVLEEFRQPVVFDYAGFDDLPPTNVTLFAGCTETEAAAAFADIPGKVQAMFPQDANIVVVGPGDNVPQRHKTVLIQTGHYVNPTTGAVSRDLGRTPIEHCRQHNDSPAGTGYVYDGEIRQSIRNKYGSFYVQFAEEVDWKNDWRNARFPLQAAQLADYLAQVAFHECSHSMGLVPTASAKYGGHNNCRCGAHYMDSGSFREPPVYLGFIRTLVQHLMPPNVSYLEFVFPSTQ